MHTRGVVASEYPGLVVSTNDVSCEAMVTTVLTVTEADDIKGSLESVFGFEVPGFSNVSELLG